LTSRSSGADRILFDTSIVADAGIIILGNIEASRFSMDVNMVNEINLIFRESATLDRFHGFIPGWQIPRLNQGIIANGWALNTEYFAEVLHNLKEMRRAIKKQLCIVDPKEFDLPGKRDIPDVQVR
jgi:ATP-dependent Lon protease